MEHIRNVMFFHLVYGLQTNARMSCSDIFENFQILSDIERRMTFGHDAI